jgi:hypothetical protein
MTRDKGEITQSDLERGWPRRVVLPAEKVLGLKNRERAQRSPLCPQGGPSGLKIWCRRSAHVGGPDQ